VSEHVYYLEDFNEYAQLAMRTVGVGSDEEMVRNGIYGVIGEFGELVELIKKHQDQGHPINLTKVTEELGDVLWYLTEIATAFHLPLALIACKNIYKLESRYPQGEFTTEHSLSRNTEEEQKAIAEVL